MTLADFLLARIDEDEAVAQAAAGEHGVYPDTTWWGQPASVGLPEHVDQEDVDHIARHDPARVLADCTAKRRVVERWRHWDRQIEDWDDPAAVMAAETLEDTMRDFAAVFSEHPDYDESWKP